MASSMGIISRRLYQSMFLSPAISCSHITKLLFCTEPSHHAYSFDADELSLDSVSETVSTSATSPDSSSLSSSGSTRQRIVADRPLEGGIDIGIYKAILVGQVGQSPLQKMLRNGRAVTLTSVGTGGMRNERIPFANEEPREYADRCMVQWHRVVVYNERLGRIVMKHAQAGSILYLEGNLETKIFTDPISGLVRRVREIAIRRNGRIVFVGNNGDFCQPSPIELKGVGYY